MPPTTATVPVATVLAVAIFGTFCELVGGGVPVPAGAVWGVFMESSEGTFFAVFAVDRFPFPAASATASALPRLRSSRIRSTRLASLTGVAPSVTPKISTRLPTSLAMPGPTTSTTMWVTSSTKT